MEKIQITDKKTMTLSAGDTLVSSGSGSVIVSLLTLDGSVISSKNIKANESLTIDVDGDYLLSIPSCSSGIVNLIKTDEPTTAVVQGLSFGSDICAKVDGVHMYIIPASDSNYYHLNLEPVTGEVDVDVDLCDCPCISCE